MNQGAQQSQLRFRWVSPDAHGYPKALEDSYLKDIGPHCLFYEVFR